VSTPSIWQCASALFAVFVLRLLNPALRLRLRLRHDGIFMLHDTCLLTCLRTTQKPMMSCQDGTFLPSASVSDWSVARCILCASFHSHLNALHCLCHFEMLMLWDVRAPPTFKSRLERQDQCPFLPIFQSGIDSFRDNSGRRIGEWSKYIRSTP
jgi:hypothetical protein